MAENKLAEIALLYFHTQVRKTSNKPYHPKALTSVGAFLFSLDKTKIMCYNKDTISKSTEEKEMFNVFSFKKKATAHSLEQPRNNGMSDGELSALKAFFFECRGDGMSMHRCDAERYERYCLVDKDTVQQWRIELIEVKLAALTSDRDDPRWNDNWQVVENIERLISLSNVPKEAYYKRWLDKIVEILPSLDKMQRILILEHFAGRNESQKDGAIYKIHTSTSLDGQMKEVIALLCDFACDESDNSEFLGWQDVPRRFASAKEDILRAYEKFGIE